MEQQVTYGISWSARPRHAAEEGKRAMAELRLRHAATSSSKEISAANGDTLTLLTFNVGLVRVAIAGITVFEPAPLIPERLAALPGALTSSGANIVALQEVFRTAHRRQIIGATQDAYPYVAWAEAPAFGLSSGLLILSDRPLEKPQQLKYSRHPLDERIYAQKGLLAATIDAGPLGPLRLVNVHTTAGGKFRDYNAPKTTALRSHQLTEVLEVAAMPSSGPTLLVGDFNTGPGAAEQNYREILGAGYIDLVKDANAGIPEADLCTWDPEQPLANGKDDHKGEPRRLDHVFIAEKDRARLDVEEARIVFREPVVPVSGGRMVPLSDHYGVLLRLGGP
jgi:endonuclease/exonuclease/phosphatase family metal-dependent hydrolase